MRKDWVDRTWIIDHLPKDIPAEVLRDSLRFYGLYVDDILIIWAPGERGGSDSILYQARDEDDLRIWAFCYVCDQIGQQMEMRNRAQYEGLWRYVRDHVEDDHWMYRENKDYRYNAIYDQRKAWFEKELQLMRPVVPDGLWEERAKEREELLNRWFKDRHWALNRDAVCFEEISDSKEIFCGCGKATEEPRPGSVMGRSVVDV